MSTCPRKSFAKYYTWESERTWIQSST